MNTSRFIKNDPRLMGENNPRWNNTDTAGWQRAQRKFSLEPCHFCGRTDHIHRHHKDGNKLNNDYSNILFVCPPHHAYVEKKLGTLYGIPFKVKITLQELNSLYKKLGSWLEVASYLGVTYRTIYNYRKELYA